MARTGRPRTAQRTRQKCATCRKSFETADYEKRQFCSRECYYDSLPGRSRQARIERISRKCARCGRTFWVAGAGRRARQVYCSRECAGVSKYPEPAALSEVDAAYLAGFFDGEGNIQRMRARSYRVRIYQSDEEVIRWIADVTGTGFVGTQKQTGSNLVKQSEFKLGWYWQLYGRNSALFLRQLLPYLHVKRALAEEAIEALESREGKPGA